jgi:hypothetical protein
MLAEMIAAGLLVACLGMSSTLNQAMTFSSPPSPLHSLHADGVVAIQISLQYAANKLGAVKQRRSGRVPQTQHKRARAEHAAMQA